MHCLQNFEIVQGVNISLEIHDSPVVVKVLQKAVNSLSPATNVKHRKAWLHQTQSYRWKKESSSPPNLSNHAISNKINHSNGRPTKSPTSSTNQRKNKSRNYMDQRITTKHGNSNHTNVKKADHANSNGFTNGHSGRILVL